MLYLRRPIRLLPGIFFALAMGGPAAFAQDYGLDTRAPIGPYLNNMMPSTNGEFAFPAKLSGTGAFSNVATLTPATGLIPYTVNSPLWSDGAAKTRWFAVPNDGPPYIPSEQIGFAPTGEWSFPNGTVFVKHFELTVNEITGEKKRLETRLLVREAGGAVYGVTYKWNPENTDADLLPGSLDENITITESSGATHVQKWSYPSRGQCLACHASAASYVLGQKTHQLNGDFTYPATGRTDNQLRTFAHLGLLNPAPNESDIPTFLKAVAVTNPTATVQHRMRSWIDANCSQCHRPGGTGIGFDARLGTPLDEQFLVDNVVFFRDLASSELYQRDNRVGSGQMPPLAKNVVDENAMANLRQWIASPFEMLSVNLYQDASHLVVRFNSHVDPVSSLVTANYTLDQGLVVSAVAPGPDPATVVLTVPSLNQNQTYMLTVSDVTDTAPSANTIWPHSQKSFAAQFEQLPTTSRLANISTRLQVGTGDDVLIGGFIMRGPPSKRVLVRALGPSLSAFGITNPLADPVLELHDGSGALIATNDSWSDNYNRQEISDAGIAPSSPKEAVILTTLPSSAAGTAYTAIVRGANNGTGTAVVEAYDLDRTDGSKLLNISTRGSVQTNDNVLIAGTIATGPGTKKVLVRAIGPSLSIPGKLSDPTLELRSANGSLLASNDNWRTSQEAEIMATQLQPSNDLESAILAILPASNAAYTAVVRGAAGSTGISVVEVYALD
jgi:mono/diheme cytochrome c family protein